jgi:hypothetical protein
MMAQTGSLRRALTASLKPLRRGGGLEARLHGRGWIIQSGRPQAWFKGLRRTQCRTTLAALACSGWYPNWYPNGKFHFIFVFVLYLTS